MDPKRSQNDIIQAVGRVIRKSKDNGVNGCRANQENFIASSSSSSDNENVDYSSSPSSSNDESRYNTILNIILVKKIQPFIIIFSKIIF